jgi:Rrf2 family protein
MIEIARNNKSGIFQKDIAKNQEISNKYLDHIMHGLKVAGLIRKRGKRGGYVLTRDPAEISLYDINSAFEPDLCIIECLENGITCDRESSCEVKGFWSKLNKLISDHYRSVNLQDLVLNKEQLEDVK